MVAQPPVLRGIVIATVVPYRFLPLRRLYLVAFTLPFPLVWLAVVRHEQEEVWEVQVEFTPVFVLHYLGV